MVVILTWVTVVILELIHVPKPDFLEGLCLSGGVPDAGEDGALHGGAVGHGLVGVDGPACWFISSVYCFIHMFLS